MQPAQINQRAVCWPPLYAGLVGSTRTQLKSHITLEEDDDQTRDVKIPTATVLNVALEELEQRGGTAAPGSPAELEYAIMQAVAGRILLMDTGMTPFAAEVNPVAALCEIIGAEMPQGWFKLVQLAAAGNTAAGATGSGPAAVAAGPAAAAAGPAAAAAAAGPAAASRGSSADGDHAGTHAGGAPATAGSGGSNGDAEATQAADANGSSGRGQNAGQRAEPPTRSKPAPKRKCPHCEAQVHSGCKTCPNCKEQLRAAKEGPPKFEAYMGGAEGTEVLNNRQGASKLTKAFDAVLTSKEMAHLQEISGGITYIMHASYVPNRELAKTSTPTSKTHMGGRSVTEFRHPTRPDCPMVVHSWASGGVLRGVMDAEAIPVGDERESLGKALCLMKKTVTLKHNNDVCATTPMGGNGSSRQRSSAAGQSAGGGSTVTDTGAAGSAGTGAAQGSNMAAAEQGAVPAGADGTASGAQAAGGTGSTQPAFGGGSGGAGNSGPPQGPINAAPNTAAVPGSAAAAVDAGGCVGNNATKRTHASMSGSAQAANHSGGAAGRVSSSSSAGRSQTSGGGSSAAGGMGGAADRAAFSYTAAAAAAASGTAAAATAAGGRTVPRSAAKRSRASSTGGASASSSLPGPSVQAQAAGNAAGAFTHMPASMPISSEYDTAGGCPPVNLVDKGYSTATSEHARGSSTAIAPGMAGCSATDGSAVVTDNGSGPTAAAAAAAAAGAAAAAAAGAAAAAAAGAAAGAAAHAAASSAAGVAPSNPLSAAVDILEKSGYHPLPPELASLLAQGAPNVLFDLNSMLQQGNAYALVVLSVRREAYGKLYVATAPPSRSAPVLYEIESRIPTAVLNRMVAAAVRMGVL